MGPSRPFVSFLALSFFFHLLFLVVFLSVALLMRVCCSVSFCVSSVYVLVVWENWLVGTREAGNNIMPTSTIVSGKHQHCSPTRLTCRLHRHMLHVRMFRTSCGKVHVLVSQVFRSATRAGSCSAWNMASNQMVRCLLTTIGGGDDAFNTLLACNGAKVGRVASSFVMNAELKSPHW